MSTKKRRISITSSARSVSNIPVKGRLWDEIEGDLSKILKTAGLLRLWEEELAGTSDGRDYGASPFESRERLQSNPVARVLLSLDENLPADVVGCILSMIASLPNMEEVTVVSASSERSVITGNMWAMSERILGYPYQKQLSGAAGILRTRKRLRLRLSRGYRYFWSHDPVLEQAFLTADHPYLTLDFGCLTGIRAMCIHVSRSQQIPSEFERRVFTSAPLKDRPVPVRLTVKTPKNEKNEKSLIDKSFDRTLILNHEIWAEHSHYYLDPPLGWAVITGLDLCTRILQLEFAQSALILEDLFFV